jgi:hypothetical protein
MPAVIRAAVEGLTDEAVAVRLIRHVGAEAGVVYGKKGKPHLRAKVDAYSQAARHSPWLILVDLDRGADCAPSLKIAWRLPNPPPPRLCFRIAVRAIEAWLLADADTISRFLGVARDRVPPQPERLDNPKTALVHLARSSRRKEIREDMVPPVGSNRAAGPAYTSRLIEFVDRHWRPDEAARHAESLDRTIRCLRRLVEERP